jgi:hypothetical protein
MVDENIFVIDMTRVFVMISLHATIACYPLMVFVLLHLHNNILVKLH